MSEFKVGQQVRVLVEDEGIVLGFDLGYPRKGEVGTVVDTEDLLESETGVYFEGRDTSWGPWIYADNELEAVK